MSNEIIQKILENTDIDEKVIAEIAKLSDKASIELDRFFSNRIKKKYAAIGFIIGFSAGILLTLVIHKVLTMLNLGC